MVDEPGTQTPGPCRDGCERHHHPTEKLPTCLHEALWTLMGDGFPDAQVSLVSGTHVTLVITSDVTDVDVDGDDVSIPGDAYIVAEDSAGFVTIESFDTVEDAQEAFTKVESDDRKARIESALSEIERMTAFALSSLDDVDCFSPDTLESAGAKFLASVRDDFVERVRDDIDDFDPDAIGEVFHEIADGAPDVYNSTRAHEFVDLGAYLEEPDSGEWPNSLLDVMGVALYQIAYRLLNALLGCVRDAIESD